MDLNMVRAGVVSHPHDWDESGYKEIQQPRVVLHIISIKTAIFSHFKLDQIR